MIAIHVIGIFAIAGVSAYFSLSDEKKETVKDIVRGMKKRACTCEICDC